MQVRVVTTLTHATKHQKLKQDDEEWQDMP